MISIYCDGSSHAKGGKPGGWAYCIVKGDEYLATGYGGDPCTSNNKMELTAAIQGIKRYVELKNMPEFEGQLVELVSDSQYTLGMASGQWNAQTNQELVEELVKLFKDNCTRARWVPGHTGDKWNEECDRQAKIGKEEAKLQVKQEVSE